MAIGPSAQTELHLSEEQVPAHVCYLDGKRIETRRHHMVACLLRQLISFELATRAFYLEHESGQWWLDQRLGDLDTIPMGGRVYNVPYAFI